MYKIIFVLFFFSLGSYANDCQVIERATKYLAQDKLKGRVSGTFGNTQARFFLKKELEKMNLEVFEHKFKKGINLYTTIYPAKSNKLEMPQVLLSSHFDGLSRCDRKIGANSNICNGAADAAAGIAAILGSIDTLKKTIKAPVLIVFFDAEEIGLLGSKAFVTDLKKLNINLKKIKVIINLDIIGLNLFSGLKNTMLAMGGETGGKKLLNDLTSASKESRLDVYNLSYSLAHNRADVASFINAKLKVPVVHITSGDGSIYHSNADEYRYLNHQKVLKTSRLITSLTLKALGQKKKYRFKKPKMFSGYALPKFNDLVLGINLVKDTLDKKSLNGFSANELNKLENMIDRLKEIKNGGKISFGPKNMQKFANISFEYMGLSRRMESIPSGSSCR
jgi:hypothetical protein